MHIHGNLIFANISVSEYFHRNLHYEHSLGLEHKTKLLNLINVNNMAPLN